MNSSSTVWGGGGEGVYIMYICVGVYVRTYFVYVIVSLYGFGVCLHVSCVHEGVCVCVCCVLYSSMSKGNDPPECSSKGVTI